MTKTTEKPYFEHRSCYVNFGEHLQNAWNVNMFYPDAPDRWSLDDWRSFLTMVRAFGFNCFEYWLAPTMFDRPAIKGDGIYGRLAVRMREVFEIAYTLGLRVKALISVNAIGPQWYFACPNIPEDKHLILALWQHWAKNLPADIYCIFPGDVGGCNRNGCSHETFADLSLEITEIIKKERPAACVEIGTWGTPFSGWGDDMRQVPGWNGSWDMLTDPKWNTPEVPCFIWNGKPGRARKAFEYLIRRLPEFPKDTMVAINLGLSPDGDATMGGDARPYAREIAKIRRITSWDYSLAEGELVCYPHWRLPRIFAKRREEASAASYAGGMTYTMSPKLNLLSLYAAGRSFINPHADPDSVSKDFCNKVFGGEHAALGELFEAFEVVSGWGYYPRRKWSKEVLVEKYGEIAERLKAADMSKCTLPLFPQPETYRDDLLWFAGKFKEMAGAGPDRERIRKEYWARALAIYDVIPMSADKRAEAAAQRFSEILQEQHS